MPKFVPPYWYAWSRAILGVNFLLIWNDNIQKEIIHSVHKIEMGRSFLRGTAPPTLKLACFVLCLKIINTFLKNNVSYSKLFKELKNSIKI